MAIYEVNINERTDAGKALLNYLLELGVVTKKLASGERKSRRVMVNIGIPEDIDEPEEEPEEVPAGLTIDGNIEDYLVLDFAVKGLFFRSQEDQDAARTLKVGSLLTMEPEPDNPQDPDAIKVFMEGGHHIGYVDRKYSEYVKERLHRLSLFAVSKVDNYGDPPYIYAKAFFKKW